MQADRNKVHLRSFKNLRIYSNVLWLCSICSGVLELGSWELEPENVFVSGRWLISKVIAYHWYYRKCMMLFIFFKPLIGRFKCGADGCLILLQCGLSAQSSLCSSFIPHTAGQCSWLIMPSSVLMINPKNPGTSQMNVFSSHILALYETAPVCLSSLMTTEFPLRSINRNLFGH